MTSYRSPRPARTLAAPPHVILGVFLATGGALAGPACAQTPETQRVRLESCHRIDQDGLRFTPSAYGDIVARVGDTVSIRLLGDTTVSRFLVGPGSFVWDMWARDLGVTLGVGQVVRWRPRFSGPDFALGQVARARGDSVWLAADSTLEGQHSDWVWSDLDMLVSRSQAARLAAIGGGAGLLMGILVEASDDSGFGHNDDSFVVVAGAFFGAIGAIVGALVGLGESREGWEPVESGAAVWTSATPPSAPPAQAQPGGGVKR